MARPPPGRKMDDHFAAEPPIRNALVEQFGGDIAVLAAGDIEASQGKSAKLPAVYLIYLGDQVRAPASPGSAQLIQQQWSIVVCVKSPTAEGTRARKDAGKIISEIIGALQGRSLRSEVPHATVPLERINGAPPLYTGARAYFDVRFSVGIQTGVSK